MRRNPGLINGVPEERWGMWCAHGHRLMVPDPDDSDSDYPRAVLIRPGTCPEPGCDPDAIEAELLAEAWDADAGRRWGW